MSIDSYRFGSIVINGRQYDSDVIIFPDRVRDNWERKSGHNLRLEDIAEVLAENPEVLILGTGAIGVMRVPPEVCQKAKEAGIELIVEPTGQACQTYNQLCSARKVVAAFHLTC
ncbi:MAG: hypothetical protein JSW30_02330 [Dehalococcoidia bacterium]|nr:MAG: hypothetical protein JSW30_02330 [Dehalococcoidia bacterium]